jgi:hypothetical protein
MKFINRKTPFARTVELIRSSAAAALTWMPGAFAVPAVSAWLRIIMRQVSDSVW